MNEMTSPPSAAELPPEYRARLASLSLLPAWTLLRAVMPVGAPVHQAQAKHWCYRDIRPELLRAGQLVTAERAERRVLAFVNPGIDPARMSTTPSIFFGLQLILPGERAPNHRHVPAAARIIVEGEGAYTTVNDEKIRMEPGDIVFTPPHRWHDHGHEGVGPVIWMDVLDHPLAVPLDISYVIPGTLRDHYSNLPDTSETHYRMAGLIPYRRPAEIRPDYPMSRYRWAHAREALDAVADITAKDDPVHLRYVNPETGENTLKTLGFSARLLRPGETQSPDKSSANWVLQMVDGCCEITINGEMFSCETHDTIAIPTYAGVTIHNNSSSPAYMIQVDDTPTQSKLGFYEEVD